MKSKANIRTMANKLTVFSITYTIYKSHICTYLPCRNFMTQFKNKLTKLSKISIKEMFRLFDKKIKKLLNTCYISKFQSNSTKLSLSNSEWMQWNHVWIILLDFNKNRKRIIKFIEEICFKRAERCQKTATGDCFPSH